MTKERKINVPNKIVKLLKEEGMEEGVRSKGEEGNGIESTKRIVPQNTETLCWLDRK